MFSSIVLFFQSAVSYEKILDSEMFQDSFYGFFR